MNNSKRLLLSIALPISLLLACPSLVACGANPSAGDGVAGSRRPPVDESAADFIHQMHHHRPAEDSIDDTSLVDSDGDQDYDPAMDSKKSARALLVATPVGSLCLVDPVDGSVRAEEDGHVMDLFATPQQPSAAVITEWKDDGTGAITELGISNEGIVRGDVTDLWSDNTVLVYGPNPALGLSFQEATVLFWGEEGETIMNPSSVWTKRGPDYVDIGLLERTESEPQLWLFRWKNGFQELDRIQVPTPEFACPPKFVREAPQPMITGIHDGHLLVQDIEGNVIVQRPNAFESGSCVEDALWMDGANAIAILAGTRATLFIASMTGTAEDQVYAYSDELRNSTAPSRRLAYDAARERVWASFGGRVGAFERSGPVELSVSCKAQSLTLVW